MIVFVFLCIHALCCSYFVWSLSQTWSCCPLFKSTWYQSNRALASFVSFWLQWFGRFCKASQVSFCHLCPALCCEHLCSEATAWRHHQSITFLVISILFLWHLLFLTMADKLPIPVLNPHNYFSCKSTIVVLLRSKGLYRVTTGSEKEPTQNVEKPKWHNHCDEALGLICLSLSPELLFHLEGIDTPHEAWHQLENLFGKTYAVRGHQLENELISLDPNIQ